MSKLTIVVCGDRNHAVMLSHNNRPEEVVLRTPDLTWTDKEGSVTKFVNSQDAAFPKQLSGLKADAIDYRVEVSTEIREWLAIHVLVPRPDGSEPRTIEEEDADLKSVGVP